jgi:signal transduction histidine kinase/ActR/RegA family two-component response regulator
VFHHLRTKLTVLYGALFAIGLGVMAAAVYAATTGNVEHMVRNDLVASGVVFDNLSDVRYRKMADEADILAHDFGFRAAVGTNDSATARSALGNLASRFGISLAFVVTPDGRVMAADPSQDGALPAGVVATVQSGDVASGVFVRKGVVYEAASAPVLTPAPAGWVVFAAPLGPDAMSGLTKLSGLPLQADILQQGADGSWASLMDRRHQKAANNLAALVSQSLKAPGMQAVRISGPDGGAVGLVRRLPLLDDGQHLVLLLRCPLKAALAPYGALVLNILLIGGLGLLSLIAASWFLARTLTRPISALADAARGLQRGETARVAVAGDDEIARLGLVFNAMAGEIVERETSLRKARDIAEAANRAKSTFLANMNHEVRTPLNGVLGVAGVLKTTRLDDRQHQMVGLIERSGTALQHIVNDMLDMVELDSGQIVLEPQPFSLNASVRALGAGAAAEAGAKGLAFHLWADEQALGWVRGDRRRIDQILDNLLSNAVKFTAEGEVSLSVTLDPDGSRRFVVSDTGMGFDPADIAQMFEPFSQIDGSMTREFGGTGLGLCLARDMARAMGGEVSAEGAQGEGAAFTLTLPLPAAERSVEDADGAEDWAAAAAPEAPAPSTLEAAPTETSVEASGLRVLVVDDHAANRQVIELILGSVGIDLVSAENGAEAVDAFKAQSFDAVLMDLQMPVMDGFTAISLIREHERNTGSPRTPIIVVSANAQAEHRSASTQAGADSHLAKPILAPTLLAALEDVLDSRAASADAERAAV